MMSGSYIERKATGDLRTTTKESPGVTPRGGTIRAISRVARRVFFFFFFPREEASKKRIQEWDKSRMGCAGPKREPRQPNDEESGRRDIRADGTGKRDERLQKNGRM